MSSKAQLLAGVVAGLLALGMHVLLTRTPLGSRMLAVAEDRSAAMLMGIRPDRMQALAWGLAAASAGIAGALMAIAYPFSPSVGETFVLTAFVVVSLGGFGSVPGAVIAGLMVGLVQALRRIPHRADLQGRRGVRDVRRRPVDQAAGPARDGVSMDPRDHPNRHARACRGHPRLSWGTSHSKTWMAGTSPAMTAPQ